MNRAEEIRLSKPEMTLHDAICAVFSPPSSSNKASNIQSLPPDDEQHQRDLKKCQNENNLDSKKDHHGGNHDGDHDNDMMVFDSDGVASHKRKNKRSWGAKKQQQQHGNNESKAEQQLPLKRDFDVPLPATAAAKSEQKAQPPPYELSNNNVKFGKNIIHKTNISMDQKLVLPEEVTSQKAVNTRRWEMADKSGGKDHHLMMIDQQQQQQPKRKKRRMINDKSGGGSVDESEDFMKLIDSVLDHNNSSKKSPKKKSSPAAAAAPSSSTKIMRTKKDLLQINDTNIQKALSYYQVELLPMIETCLLEAGFTSEQSTATPNNVLYVKFIKCAAKSTMDRMDLLRKTIPR